MTLRERIFDSSMMKNLMLNKLSVELGVLRVLKGEINRKEDSSNLLSDSAIVSLIKKMIEDINSTSAPTKDVEVKFLEQFVPKQVSSDELRGIISEFITVNNLSDAKSLGLVMSHLKTNYAGLYDGSLASTIAKEVLCK